MVSLKRLNIWHNQITDISPLQNLVNLKELNISENQISEFPYFLKNFVKLKEISFLPNPYKIKNSEYLFKLFENTRVGSLEALRLSSCGQENKTVAEH